MNLDVQTIALNATHHFKDAVSGENMTFSEYDVHGLFGHMQSKVTYEQLKTNNATTMKDKRLFISSTSTFAGSGQYVQHSLARMRRTWDHLKYSIAGIMNMNMFGIPFTGADVCGSLADKKENN